MKLLIAIPAYNEAENIERVVDNLIQNYPQYDYIVINDGSRDSTARICRENHYHLLDLPINLGLAGAFQAGMKYADRKGYDCLLQLDGDGQHRPEYIASMLAKMEAENLDIVIGSRFVTEKKPLSARMLGSRMLVMAIRITTGQKLTDPTSGMRMFSRNMIREFSQNINYGPEPDTMAYLIKNGAKVGEAQVQMDERMAGESYLNFARSVRYMLNMFVSILFIQNFRKRR